jgi:hypothetical protein
MIRLGIIGEGLSEQNLAAKIIHPHLLSSGIYSFARQIVTKRKASQKDAKGGMPCYTRVKDDILRLINEDQTLIVTSMFDYYALPRDFPGFKEICNIQDPYKKIAHLEKSFLDDIDNERFLPYIQLHEIETLLFADIQITHNVLSMNNPKSSFKALEKILLTNPELINDGPSTAPSKRIIALYPDYQKSVDLLNILQLIGLPKIREKCKHFNDWITQLEFLSK